MISVSNVTLTIDQAGMAALQKRLETRAQKGARAAATLLMDRYVTTEAGDWSTKPKFRIASNKVTESVAMARSVIECDIKTSDKRWHWIDKGTVPAANRVAKTPRGMIFPYNGGKNMSYNPKTVSWDVPQASPFGKYGKIVKAFAVPGNFIRARNMSHDGLIAKSLEMFTAIGRELGV